MMEYCGEKMHKCEEYVEALEEERRKIQVFQRELPLCLELVTKAIETCKNRLSQCSEEKSEWLRSAQLWNQSPDPPIEQEEVKRNGGGEKKEKDGTRRCWSPDLHRRNRNRRDLGSNHQLNLAQLLHSLHFDVK